MSLVPLPKVPTDNLYKFLALSGVVIIVLSLYSSAHESDEWYARLDALRTSVEVLGTRTGDDRKAVLQTIKDRFDAIPPIPKKPDQAFVDAATSQAEKAREMLEAQIRIEAEAQQAYKEAAARNKVELAAIDRAGNYLVGRNQARWVLACIGLVVAALGFFRWYFKIQVHIDRAYAAGVFGKDEKG